MIIKRLTRFLNLCEKYNIPIDDRAGKRIEQYFQRLLDRYGIDYDLSLPVRFTDNIVRDRNVRVIQDK